MKFASKLILCMLTCPSKLHDCAHVRVFLSVWFSVQHVELVVSQQLQNQQEFPHRLKSYGILYDKFANSIQHLRLIKIAYLCTLSIHIQIQYLYRYYLISFLIAIGLAITLYVFAYVNSFLPLHQTYLCLNMLLGDTLPQVKLALNVAHVSGPVNLYFNFQALILIS